MPSQTSRRSLWRRYLEFPLIGKLAIALVAGVIAGLTIGEPITVIAPLGEIFLRLLAMLVMPLIIFTLIAGVSSVSPGALGRIGAKAFVFYLVTSAFAITVGLGLALAVMPGAGLSMPGGADQEGAEAPPLSEVFMGIVPKNPFAALVEGNVLAVMFASIVAGVALTFMRGSQDARLRDLGDFLGRGVDAIVELIFLVIRGVLQYSPIGVFALIAVAFGETGLEAVAPLAKLTGVVYGGVAAQIVVYVVLLLLFRANVGRFFGAAKEPMMTAFVTRSSSGTLPVTSQAAEKLGIGKGVYSFTLPLGATVNMDGTALYVGASTIFIANVAGVELTLAQLLTVVLVGVLASIGTAGVPGAGLIMLTMTVSQLGLPMAPLALIAGIDALLDMVRTMCNVTGDLTGTRIIARTEPGMLRDPDTAESETEADTSSPDPEDVSLDAAKVVDPNGDPGWTAGAVRRH